MPTNVKARRKMEKKNSKVVKNNCYSSGMTTLSITVSRAFTLIELLVVVLLIGILAAIALPQYQKTIVKSRLTSAMPIINSLKKAFELYYTENGQYPEDMDQLLIQLPNSCHVEYRRDGVDIQCNDYYYICTGTYANLMEGMILLSYCPNYTQNYNTCAPHRELVITFYLTHPNRSHSANLRIPNTSLCEPQTNFGRQVCRSLLGTVVDKVYGD